MMNGVLLAHDIYPNTLLPLALAGMFKGKFLSVVSLGAHCKIICNRNGQ